MSADFCHLRCYLDSKSVLCVEVAIVWENKKDLVREKLRIRRLRTNQPINNHHLRSPDIEMPGELVNQRMEKDCKLLVPFLHIRNFKD